MTHFRLPPDADPGSNFRGRLTRKVVRLAFAGFVLAVLPLAGCDGYRDSYQRTGSWHPEGVNELNIAAQVADPHDLVRGRDSAAPNYRTAATAVADLWSGKTTKAAAAAAVASGGTTGAGQ